jgi:hypothetical protein
MNGMLEASPAAMAPDAWARWRTRQGAQREASYSKGGRCDYRIKYEDLSKLTASFGDLLTSSADEIDFDDFVTW